ncbi:hypothetical protein [Paraglaciecola sp. 2405UD69-4]|uniref:hypothetical protein n=1 Tax=Paraglaciecola sp. 2405UD69-4 TaxID=3391836 RepID=UPI0039C96021
MKIKLIAVLLTCALSSGCASTSNRFAKDFFDGASSSAERRQNNKAYNTYSNKGDFKNDLIEDSMSGVLTAFFRGIFSLGSDNN